MNSGRNFIYLIMMKKQYKEDQALKFLYMATLADREAVRKATFMERERNEQEANHSNEAYIRGLDITLTLQEHLRNSL